MKEIRGGKIHGHFSPNFPASLLGASTGHCQTGLEDESEMMRNQLGNAQYMSNGRSAARDALRNTTQ
jgi:hypothetical protein